MANITVWHNPKCGSSRNALAYLEEKGIEPEVYLYLAERPGKAEIEAVLKALSMKPSQVLRPKEDLAEQLGLYDGASEKKILAAMAEHARLIQRPIVISSKGGVIARPKENIDEIL